MSADKTLSLVPESGPAAPEPSTAVLVRLGLTYTGGPRPLELVLCSDNQNGQGSLVRVGSRTARCGLCKQRHRVVGLLEAIGSCDISVGGESGAVVCIPVEELFGPMFRELQSRARKAGQKPADRLRKGAGRA